MMNRSRRAVAFAATGVLTALAVGAGGTGTAADGGERRVAPDRVPYLNTNTHVVHDRGRTMSLQLRGMALELWTTVHGYAVVDDRVATDTFFLTLYNSSGPGTVLARQQVPGQPAYLDPVVSGNGERIAYLHQPRPHDLLRIVVRRTKDGELVYERGLQEPHTALLAFRDGKVWFSQRKRFAGTLDVSSGNVRKVRKGSGILVAANPGTRRAERVIGDRRQIVQLGGEPKPLWRVPEDEVLAWSPNGRHVLTVDYRGHFDRPAALAVRKSRTGELVRKVRHRWFAHPPAIVWQGSKAFLAVRGGERHARLVRYGLRGSTKVVATFGPRHPDSAPWMPAAPRP